MMRGIGAALLVGRRIVAKDGRAPLGTGHILGEGGAKTTQTEDTTKGGGGDGFEGLAPRGTGGQDFRKFIKL